MANEKISVEIEGFPTFKLQPLWYVVFLAMLGVAVYSAMQPNQFLGTMGWVLSMGLWVLVGIIGGKYATAVAAMGQIKVMLESLLQEMLETKRMKEQQKESAVH